MQQQQAAHGPHHAHAHAPSPLLLLRCCCCYGAVGGGAPHHHHHNHPALLCMAHCALYIHIHMAVHGRQCRPVPRRPLNNTHKSSMGVITSSSWRAAPQLDRSVKTVLVVRCTGKAV
jgi:hypothetical protein